MTLRLTVNDADGGFYPQIYK